MRRVVRWVRELGLGTRVGVALVSACVATWSIWTLPTEPWRRSTVGYWLKGSPIMCVRYASLPACVVLPADDVQWIFVPEQEFWTDADSGRWSAEQQSVAWYASPIRRSWDEGFLAPTRHRSVAGIRLVPLDYSAPIVSPPASARIAVIDWLESSPDDWVRSVAASVASGDIDRTSILPLGWARNAVIVASALLAVTVLPWIGLARLLRKRPDWQCQSCGYDLRGLPAGVCPECGMAPTAE